ncbi:MAG: hypothetical protein AB1782_17175 [Cyanobacteriota bacterium]
MKVRRSLYGAETTEVALVSVILLVVSIGAVTVFGGNIQKVFQSEDSPIYVSSEKMQNSSDEGDVDGDGSRTNIDKSLVSTSLITKARSDSSIGSSIGHETTGATGGDFEIGGTYQIDDPSALNDGDPSTTGNALLDAALAAKNSAMDLLNQALSLQANADVLQDQVENMTSNLFQQQEVLTDLENGYASLIENMLEVGTHLDLLVYLEAQAQSIQVDLSTTLTSLGDVNADIIHATAQNMIVGQELLDLDKKQREAYDDYCDLRDTYDSSWDTVCSGDPPSCDTVNTSGIDPADIDAALALSDQLLSELNGEIAAIQNAVSTYSGLVANYNTQAAQAQVQAQDLLNQAESLLATSFTDPNLFNGCTTVQEYLDKATWALGEGGQAVVDATAVANAVNLLHNAQVAYNDAEQLQALAQHSENNVTQLQEILILAEADATSLSLSAETFDTSAAESVASTNENVLTNVNPQIGIVADELVTVDDAYNNVASAIAFQQSYVAEMTTQVSVFEAEFNSVASQASTLLTDAQTALASATQAVDDLVCTPEEQPCE